MSVRDHILIAHSLSSKTFGPAQKLHGATYIIDLEFARKELDGDNIVIDIGLASRILSEVSSELNYRNLDEMEEFKYEITTTEFLARYIHEKIRIRIESIFRGFMKVTLHESHLAWASYETEVE